MSEETPVPVKPTLAEAIEHERSTVKHEEELIHRRLTWLLTLQGFLFAAIVLSVKAESSPVNQASSTGLASTLQWLIPAVGFFSALVTFLGVLAAYCHITFTRKELDKYYKERTKFGSLKWSQWVGRGNSMGLLVILMAAWAVLFFQHCW